MKRLSIILLVALFNLIPQKNYAQEIQGTYAIKNVETGVYLRIKDANKQNGTPIVAYSPVNWKCVTWEFKSLADQSYQLINLFSGKTLQPQNSNPADGVSLEEQPVSANLLNQQFEFIPVSKGIYLIRLKGTELYLTPSDNKGTINAGILLTKRNNSKLQQWTLKEQHPEI